MAKNNPLCAKYFAFQIDLTCSALPGGFQSCSKILQNEGIGQIDPPPLVSPAPVSEGGENRFSEDEDLAAPSFSTGDILQLLPTDHEE